MHNQSATSFRTDFELITHFSAEVDVRAINDARHTSLISQNENTVVVSASRCYMDEDRPMLIVCGTDRF